MLSRTLLVALALTLTGAAARAAGQWLPLANDASCSVWDDSEKPDTSAVWTGGCVNRRASGNGTLIWRIVADGNIQEQVCSGDMRNGKMHGRGTCQWSSGGRYDGGWSDGLVHGRGVELYPDGSRYEGGFWLGSREGEGTYEFADGGRYVGAWRAGALHGQGVRTYANGARYDGGWADDRYHGHGTVQFANGDRCEGEWQAGTLVGTGIGFTDGKATTCRFDTKNNQVSFGE